MRALILRAASVGVAVTWLLAVASAQQQAASVPIDADDIGGVAAFLASPAARFITGQVIVADGGVTIA